MPEPRLCLAARRRRWPSEPWTLGQVYYRWFIRSAKEGRKAWHSRAERCSDALERALDRHRRDWHRVCVVPFARKTVDDVDHAIELSGHTSEYHCIALAIDLA